MDREVRAAGGVVRRSRGDGSAEMVVIHRPRYGDWTLPKGKLDPGESHEEGALREVQEETGLRCVIEGRAGSVSYRDRRGRPKTVVYYFMTPTGGDFAPNTEVDELRWLTPDEAQDLLTYAHDRRLVAGIADTSPL